MIWIPLLLGFLLGVNCDGGDFRDVPTVKLQLNENPYRHSLTLDPRGKYRLEWEVDRKKELISFSVTVETKGYVGFGLSKKGTMKGADIVIGGVDSKGNPYFSDRHAKGHKVPIPDKSQDWTLHEAWEKGTLTFLSFSRHFDTCDSQGDLEINDDLVSVIWAFGEKDDEIQYHYGNRGSYDLYLLDPNVTPESLLDTFQAEGILPVPVRPSLLGDDTIKASVFSMTERRTVPQQDTLYWCSFHKVPTTSKHHIIGYQTVFPTEQDRRSVHHLLLHRCIAPQGSEAFETLSQSSFSGGGECYLGNNVGPPGFSLCREEMVGWGVGGRAVFFPEHVGLPMSEFGEEFYMLQVHYDNPNLVSNLVVSTSLELYYTNKPRKNDGAMLIVGSSIPGATNLVIPPSSLEHEILGYCPPGCTKRMFPKEGVTVFGGVLHTHLAGREARLRHFRNGTELPWIIKDDNYNFNYQQVRQLAKERKVFPGDQLIQKCVYDSTQRNGTVVTGGYSTREEMCVTFLYYYNRVPGITSCLSEIRDEGYWNLLDIGNTTFDVSKRETVVTNPPDFAGVTVSNFLTYYIDEWNEKFREEVQRQHLFQSQVSTCPLPSSPGFATPATAPVGIFRNRIVEVPLEKPSFVKLKPVINDFRKNIIQLSHEKQNYEELKPVISNFNKNIIQLPLEKQSYEELKPVINDFNKNVVQVPLQKNSYEELKPVTRDQEHPSIQNPSIIGDVRRNIIQLPLGKPSYVEREPVDDIWKDFFQLPIPQEKPSYGKVKPVSQDQGPHSLQNPSVVEDDRRNIIELPVERESYGELKPATRDQNPSVIGDVRRNIIQLPLEKPSYVEREPVVDDIWKDFFQLSIPQEKPSYGKPVIREKRPHSVTKNHPSVVNHVSKNIIQLPLEKPSYEDVKPVTQNYRPLSFTGTPSVNDDDRKNIIQFPQEKPSFAKLKYVPEDTKHRHEFRGSKSPIVLKTSFLNNNNNNNNNKLHYDFSLGNEAITKTGRQKRSTSLNQHQSSIVHEEIASLPSLVAEYRPEAKCNLHHHRIEDVKERKEDEQDFKSYQNYDHDGDEKKHLLNQLDYDDHRWLRK